MNAIVDQPQLLLCTCPSLENAQSLAVALVEQELAACVNILPQVQSIYRWQSQIEQSSEVLLIIKAMQRNYLALAAYINEHHPYDVPELIAVDITHGLPNYLHWIEEICK